MIRLPVCAAVGILALSGPALTLENESVRVEFLPASKSFSVCGIVNRLADDVRFVQGDSCLAPLWRLKFRSTVSGETVEVTAGDAGVVPHSESDRQSVRFNWKDIRRLTGGETFDVSASVSLEGRKGASVWNIAVTNRHAGWKLVETRFPEVTRTVLPIDPSAKFLVPSRGTGGGRLYSVGDYAAHAEFCGGLTPHGLLPMCAVLRGTSGLYVAATEGDASVSVGPDGSVSVSSATGVPVELNVFRGDWWTAARLHRAWAMTRPWCARGSLRERSDVAARIKDASVWVLDRRSAVEAAAPVLSNRWTDMGHLVLTEDDPAIRQAGCGLPYALERTQATDYDVPLFDAVYSGYSIRLGGFVSPDCEYWEGFWPLAREVSYGRTVTSTLAAAALGKDNCDMPGIYRQLGCFRRDHADFLIYGTLEGEVTFAGWKPERIAGTVWRNADGRRRGAVVYGTDPGDPTVKFSFPGSDRLFTVRVPACEILFVEEKD